MRPLRGHPIAALLVGCGLAWTGAAVAGTDSEQDGHRADAVLADALTVDQLSDLAGIDPTRCFSSAPDSVLCEWRLGNRRSGWQAIAAALGSEDRVRLLCELPADGSPRAPGSCTAHVQRSQRDRWRVPLLASNREQRLAEKRRQAIARMEGARSLVELARLVGGTPEVCRPNASGEQVCMWRVTSRNHGHGILASSIGAPLRKKLRMHCVLPIDGGARAWESCAVEIGG